MARTIGTPDVGSYNQPAEIQAPAAWADDGQGGNANAGQWVTVRSPMILLASGQAGRGSSMAYKYGQLYPEARHWAQFNYASDVAIDPRMTLVNRGRRYRILGAIDVEERHVTSVLALVEYQAKGST